MKKIISFVLGVFLMMSSASAHAASVKDMISHGLEPIGNCLYVYGGGWNEADTGAGAEAMRYGVSDQWNAFYRQHGADYNYKNFRYQIHDGLDCTGYVGWTMYQTFGDRYSKNGYVYLAKNMAKSYSEIFDGTFKENRDVCDYQCGDVMSSNGHAYLVLGRCDDGSVVLMHASPPNVSICGTYTPSGNRDSDAIWLAKQYMKTYFSKCYQKFPNVGRESAYLTDYHQFRFSSSVLADSDGYRRMNAKEVLYDLFCAVKVYHAHSRLQFDAEPYIDRDTTYVPLRGIAEGLGGTAEWNAEKNKATITLGSQSVLINMTAKTATKDGTVYAVDMQNKYGRMMLPLRKVSELLGINVSWDGKTKSVYLT